MTCLFGTLNMVLYLHESVRSRFHSNWPLYFTIAWVNDLTWWGYSHCTGLRIAQAETNWQRKGFTSHSGCRRNSSNNVKCCWKLPVRIITQKSNITSMFYARWLSLHLFIVIMSERGETHARRAVQAHRSVSFFLSLSFSLLNDRLDFSFYYCLLDIKTHYCCAAHHVKIWDESTWV